LVKCNYIRWEDGWQLTGRSEYNVRINVEGMSIKASGSQAPLRYSVSSRHSDVSQAYSTSLEKERNPTQESIDDRLRKRKRRAITVRAADVGKEAQDMRIPTEENYKTKKVSQLHLEL
jgi:hypothetical protein